jgi:hypothetical protein
MKVFFPLLLLLLGTAGFFIWKARDTTSLGFSANGVVEEADFKNNKCSIKVAIYEWINLEGDFNIADIPQRSDRYTIHGSGEACQALPVAMSATNQHISFEIGYINRKWQLVKNPTAALGCGGLNMNWTPDPES